MDLVWQFERSLEIKHEEKVQFEDRKDATRKLLDILPVQQMIEEEWIVVSISTGGVLTAKEIGKEIQAPFDFLFTEPIPAPNNPECHVAMVSETEEIVIHEALIESFGITLDYIYGEAHRRYEEKILKYIYRYRKGQTIRSLQEKNVLLVDEGIDTGLTMMAAVKTAIAMNAKSVSFAVPVMPLDVKEMIEEVIDEVYCFHMPYDFVDVPYYYKKIAPLKEAEVDEMLKDIQNTKG